MTVGNLLNTASAAIEEKPKLYRHANDRQGNVICSARQNNLSFLDVCGRPTPIVIARCHDDGVSSNSRKTACEMSCFVHTYICSDVWKEMRKLREAERRTHLPQMHVRG